MEDDTMMMWTDDVLQDCETWAHQCDGEPGEFARMVPPLAQLSAPQVAALAAFFLDRNMDDHARFLAGYARALWLQKQAAPGPQAARRDWLVKQARIHEADALEPVLLQ
jgi:hypothetical protein